MSANHLSLVDQKQKPATTGMITPAGTIEQALEQFRLYQELKTRLGTEEDFQPFKNKKTGEVRNHPKKSFVRKVQRFFNLSCEITQDEPLYDKNGKMIAWLAKARAIHLGTGAYQEADGSCSMDEKIQQHQTIHNIRAHAITRAKNRAILDLVGFGEVSAEEINEREYYQANQPQQKQETPEQRRQRGIKAMYAAANEKKLTKEETKTIMKAETGKESANDMTLDELRKMYKYFKNHSSEELKEVAKAHLVQNKTVIDVDPETGEIIDPDVSIDDKELEKILSHSNGGEF
ncbi:hypothetical protein H1164_16745 [Thermoactinomyces daqus]|uniref:Uncharacterized protein n=1 Tax=Thermoactinomyces daqus TaxID=1329516 RepID=A0A7W2AK22_9BACL|nr:hypothetical protein [Thermoactinomyces daqus]MBA4544483.1 hypothetical protein [Thermoactinomyces daqus]